MLQLYFLQLYSRMRFCFHPDLSFVVQHSHAVLFPSGPLVCCTTFADKGYSLYPLWALIVGKTTSHKNYILQSLGYWALIVRVLGPNCRQDKLPTKIIYYNLYSALRPNYILQSLQCSTPHLQCGTTPYNIAPHLQSLILHKQRRVLGRDAPDTETVGSRWDCRYLHRVFILPL